MPALDGLNTRTLDGNHPLVRLVRGRGCEAGVEVGVWQGDLSRTLLGLTAIRMLYLVDTWRPRDTPICDLRTDMPLRNRLDLQEYVARGWVRWPSEGQMEATRRWVFEATQLYGRRSQIIPMPSPEAAELFRACSLDFVYIDAMHLYEDVKADIEGWMSKVRIGGILCGDDYASEFPGVVQAVDERFGDRVNQDGRMWWVKV